MSRSAISVARGHGGSQEAPLVRARVCASHSGCGGDEAAHLGEFRAALERLGSPLGHQLTRLLGGGTPPQHQAGGDQVLAGARTPVASSARGLADVGGAPTPGAPRAHARHANLRGAGALGDPSFRAGIGACRQRRRG